MLQRQTETMEGLFPGIGPIVPDRFQNPLENVLIKFFNWQVANLRNDVCRQG